MTSTLHRALLVFVALSCSMISLTATAVPITYIGSFAGTGTVNGNPFDGNVQFIFNSDTTLVYDNGSGLFLTPYGTASFYIQGIGAGEFTDLFQVFDYQYNAVTGFFDKQLVTDIVDLSNPVFAGYDLKSDIGPLTTDYFGVHTGLALGSTLGEVILDLSGTPTFTATTTPEPASVLLFGSSLAGIAAMLRRKLGL